MFVTLSCLALVVCQNSSASSQEIRDADRSFGYDLYLSPGELLRYYAWDGDALVPFVGRERVVHIDFGERGLAADARLYLPCSSLVEGLASGARYLDRDALTFDRGRYGEALRFERSSYLRLALPPSSPTVSGWTLSFWLRPESGAAGRSLVLLPGAVELTLLSDLRVHATLLPSGEQLTHPGALALGQWSFVSLSYDPNLLRDLLLFVDGTSVNVPFSASAPARQANELRIGDPAHAGGGFVGLLDELALEPGTTSTAHALRDELRAPAPGNHALALTTTYGERDVEPAARATREPWLDTAAEFESGELSGVAYSGDALRWTSARWTRLDPLHAPPPRTTHALVSLGGSRLFTFSGEVRDTHRWPMRNTPDTWIYDGNANAWSEVASPVAPPGRCHVPAAYSPDDDLVLLVGGWHNDYQPGNLYDDTWVFHVSTRTWEQRFPSGPSIGPTSDIGLVYLPALKKFLMVRGRQNWLYDPRANAWQILPPAAAVTESGQPSSFVFGGAAMCALDPTTGLVLVFGGATVQPDVFLDGTALYDVGTNTYTVLAPPVHPTGRVRSGFAWDPRSQRFVLFGGVRDQFSVRNDDLWVFDPRTRRWTELECSNRPSRRGGYYGMAYDDARARFVLWGGRENADLWNDETWALELDEKRPGTAVYTFDRLQDREREHFLVDPQTPGDSSVSFRYRTSDSGVDWGPWSSGPSFGRARFLQVQATLTPGSRGEIPQIRRMGLR